MVLLFIPEITLPLPGVKPSVIVLIDASRSMDEKNKVQMLKDLLSNLEHLKSGFSFRIYEFGDSLATSASFSNIRLDNKKTDIGKTLDGLQVENAEAVLLISDGRHNGHIDPALIRLKVPLWTFAVGQDNLPDLAVEEISFDNDTASHTKINLRIRLRSNLKEPIYRNLEIYSQEKILQKVEVNLTPQKLTEINVPVFVNDTITTLKIRLDSIPNEDRTDNNVQYFRVVSGRDKIRLLFVSNLITDDTRELLRTLREMPRFSLSTRLELTSGKFSGDAVLNPQVILVGPLGPNLSTPTKNLLNNNLNKGTPVLFVNSAQNLPAELQHFLPLKEVSPGTTRNVSTTLSDILLREWEPLPVNAGDRNYVATSGTDIVYSKNKTGFISAAKTPVHSMAMEFPDLGSQIKLNRKGFESFLESSLLYTMDSGTFPFSIRIEDFKDGHVKATLYSEVPVQTNDLVAWLSPDSFPLSISPVTSKSFNVEGMSSTGTYAVNIAWHGKRYLFKEKIDVFEPVQESPSRGANYELLKQLAQNNKGEFISDVKDIQGFVSSLPKGKAATRFKPIENPYFVVLIGSLLLLEIWQRRKNGLP